MAESDNYKVIDGQGSERQFRALGIGNNLFPFHINTPSKQLVPLGVFDEVQSVDKFGNGTVGTIMQPIWPNGIFTSFPSAASVVSISSDSANDTAAGSGMRTITVQGLDQNGDQASETVTLNGTSTVQTTGQFLRINRAFGDTFGNDNFGATAANDGEIEITISGTTVAVIAPNTGQTEQMIYSVPRGFVATIDAWEISVGSGKEVIAKLFTLFSGESNPGWRVRRDGVIYQSSLSEQFYYPVVVPARTDIILGAQTTGATARVSGHLDITINKLSI